jgi:hypothetical protein
MAPKIATKSSLQFLFLVAQLLACTPDPVLGAERARGLSPTLEELELRLSTLNGSDSLEVKDYVNDWSRALDASDNKAGPMASQPVEELFNSPRMSKRETCPSGGSCNGNFPNCCSVVANSGYYCCSGACCGIDDQYGRGYCCSIAVGSAKCCPPPDTSTPYFVSL